MVIGNVMQTSADAIYAARHIGLKSGVPIDTPALAERQRAGFARVRAGMEKGAPEAPLVDPAERVLAQWDQRLATGT